MTDTYYDSDDYYTRSPGLKPQTVNYEYKESPPPFINNSQTRETSPSRSHMHRSFQGAGDAAIIRNLDQNRPDIADRAREDPLLPLDDEYYTRPRPQPKKSETESTETPPASERERVARQALTYLHSMDQDGSQSEHGPRDSSPRQDTEGRASSQLAPGLPVRPESASKDHSQDPLHGRPDPERKNLEDIPETSPLRKYAIHAPERPDQASLPPLQRSPPSAPANSPDDNNRQLPSLHSFLDELKVAPPPNDHPRRTSAGSTYPFSMTRGYPPSIPRNSLTRELQPCGPFPAPQVPLSPYSHFSPTSSNDISNMPSPASQVQSWAPTLKPDMHNAPLQSAKSPAACYPTPTEQTQGTVEKVPLSTSTAQSGVPITTVGFKCDYPGCDAPPFQTQYLLNSHANVHSQDRPHFCPVPGCSRGVGGKGFKRKNEMLRHGLVHDSPSYICPFCPHQQHKYPRPDNLQRHVRVHHGDKTKDDPELRKVLSRRPEGSARGRRRRNT